MQPQPKITKSGQEAREAALRGVEQVYEAVSATLGPRSANVAIARPFGRPAVVHDGVTVAKEILPLADSFENVGAELAVEAADKTNAIGDGTTTATVLMREIAKNAHTFITAGSKPMALREGIEAATRAVVNEITELSTPVEGKDQKANVENVKRIATVSAQNEEIGDMVAEAYAELGKDGIMSVEESRGSDSFLEIKTGMEFDRGWRSPYFINDPMLGEASIEKPYVLVTDANITSLEHFGPMFEKLFAEGVKDIVIIANDIDAMALAFLIKNHVQGNIRALAIAAPSFGDKRTDALKDIAIITGASFVSQASGMSIQSVTKAMLGQAGRITSSATTTLIVDGAGPQEDVDARAAEIKAKADNPDTGEYDQEKLMERYAKFKSGVAVLTIGAKSESEIKERKERAIDAISAAKAALSDGIVPGGGTTLIVAARNAQLKLEADEHPSTQGRDFQAGAKIVFDACEAPFRKLLENAGYDPGNKLAALEAGKIGEGIDVVSGDKVNMIEAGIIDPALVVKAALENASSNAVMIATTNVIVVEVKQETK